MKGLLDLQPKVESAIGIWSEGDWAIGARLSNGSSTPTVELTEEVSLNSPDVKSVYTLAQRLGHEQKDPWIISALPAQKVLLRPLHVTLTKPADIDKVLSFQAEPLLPYPLEEAIIGRYIIHSSAEGSDLCLAAVRHDDLSEHLQLFQQEDIDPESTSSAPSGLATFAALYCPESPWTLVIDIESTSSTCTLAHAGVPVGAYHVPVGLDKDPNSEPSKELLQKLALAGHSLFKQVTDKTRPPLLLVGLGSQRRGWQEIIAKHLDIPIAACSAPADHLRFACPIGLATSVLSPDQPSLNLRKGPLAYPKPWKRFTYALFSFAAACLVLAFALLAFGQARVYRQDHTLRQEYASLLDVLGVSFDDFEQRYRGQAAPADFDLSMLDREGIQKRLTFIQNDLSKPQEIYPLEPATPKVADLLGWLSTFFDKELKLETFGYTMVKRPDPKHPKDRYQVRVDLEFTATPQKAKSFHDALMATNPFVASAQSVKWSSAGGVYRTSFDLQDRTIY